MTYCLGIKLTDGIILASDSRTSAGVDNVSTYSKMFHFQPGPDRIFFLLTSGNLGTTQSVVNHLQRELKTYGKDCQLGKVEYMYDAAQYIGELCLRVQKQTQHEDKSTKKFEASFILAGQIGDQDHDILLIYPEGNFIEASPVKPYLQIGETKYGKPILDRIITPKTSLEEAARCALVSLDSTMRSNLSVGPPLEIMIYQRNSLEVGKRLVFDAQSEYYHALKKSWNDGLQSAFDSLPRFEWEK